MWDIAYYAGYRDCTGLKCYSPVVGYEDAYDLGWRAGERDNQQDTFC